MEEVKLGSGPGTIIPAVQSRLHQGDLNGAYALLTEHYRKNPNDTISAHALINLQHSIITQLNQSTYHRPPMESYCLSGGIAYHLLANYVAILQQKLRRSNLTCIILGSGGATSANQELLSDLGVRIGGYALRSRNFYSEEDSAFEDIAWNDFDFVLVAAGDAEQERQIIQQLRTNAIHRSTQQPVYLAHYLELGFLHALSVIPELRTCLNIRKLALIALTAALTKDGPIIECGAYRCGTSAFLGALHQGWKQFRPVHAIDTFEGMPPPVAKDGSTVYQPGTFAEALLGDCEQYIRNLGLASSVDLHKGLVQEVLPNLADSLSECRFLFSDTDQYSGTKASLDAYLPKMTQDSFIIIDDYRVLGVTRAINEAQQAWPDFDGFELTQNFFIGWRGLTMPGLSMISPGTLSSAIELQRLSE